MKELSNLIIILFLSCLSVLQSCSEEVAPANDNFVVEAFITANAAIDNVKVKSTSPVGSDTITTASIENADVTLTFGDDEFPLDFNTSTGLYNYTGGDLDIIIGERYDLQVRVGDRSATATTVVPEQPTNLRLSEDRLIIPTLRPTFALREEITTLFFEERIRLEWDAKPGERYFVVIEGRQNEPDPLLPEVVPDEARELLSSFRFISEPAETPVFEIIGVALENYGPYVAKVFTVNKEYADLFSDVGQDSRDLNEPPSNVNNALGIFTAFASDSIFFELARN